MQYTTRNDWTLSRIGFGAWAIGGSWGTVPESDAIAALNTAIDAGVTFIDTADVYGDGRSERLIRQVLRNRSEDVVVATKLGRRLDPHTADGYNRANMQAFIERSLENLGVDQLDLVQLHCPPTEVYYRPAVFAALDDMVSQGLIKQYGVSVEKVEEGIKALEYPHLASVQIIFNILRQRPAEVFFDLAEERDVAVIVRVPLASGLLTGKMTHETTFDQDDHRHFNREGQAFDRGETFAGVDYAAGLDAVEQIRPLVPPGTTMAQFALRWILMHDAVTVTIPGAKNPDQAQDNANAADFPPLSDSQMARLREIYQTTVYDPVHYLW
jgi:aryl-alcohol dehydrogenase-like predicted oxidoreductase